MAATPRFKVYDADGHYQAACKEPEAACALMWFYGDGATIRAEHDRIVWTEGKDGTGADSYDAVVETIWRKLGE